MSMSGSDQSSRAWLLEELESDAQPEHTKVEDGGSNVGDSLPLFDCQADPKSAPMPAPEPALMPTPTSAAMPAPLPAPYQPAISPDAQADSASPVVIGPANNGSALNSPVSSSPASNAPIIYSPASYSPASNSPAPAPAAQHVSSAVTSLVVRVGLQGQQCWSQTVCVSAGMTVGAVWDDCAAYLGVEQACCILAFCDGQAVSAADQTMAAFGSSSAAHLDFTVSPHGPHALHIRMMDPSSNAVEAIFMQIEQVSSALQRWAGSLGLCFEDLLFLHAGHTINALATFW